jgi:hypothetical protein|tara:strand:- start:672 stop:1451 length:780 start_codon:yes stop_codon:yes gene_type:complete
MKTPIKTKTNFYCGDILKNLIPTDRRLKSLLLYSGQLECELSFSDYDLTIITNKWAIFEFWDCLIKNPYLIADMANGLHEKLNPQMVYLMQDNWPRFKDPYFRSAMFLLLNRYSSDGTISHGQFDTSNYSPLSGKSLINFCENYDLSKLRLNYKKAEKYYECLGEIEDDEVLLLPVGKIGASPLSIQTRIGHEVYDLNYNKLKNILHDYKKDFVAICCFNQKIMRDHSNFNTLLVAPGGEITSDPTKAAEMIITNLRNP